MRCGAWRYPPPYDFYDGDIDPPLNPERFFAALDAEGELGRLLLLRGEAARPRLRPRPASRPRRAGARARLLPRRARVRARALRPRRVFLHVAEFNERARRVYERAGLRGRLTTRAHLRALRRRAVPDDGGAEARRELARAGRAPGGHPPRRCSRRRRPGRRSSASAPCGSCPTSTRSASTRAWEPWALTSISARYAVAYVGQPREREPPERDEALARGQALGDRAAKARDGSWVCDRPLPVAGDHRARLQHLGDAAHLEARALPRSLRRAGHDEVGLLRRVARGRPGPDVRSGVTRPPLQPDEPRSREAQHRSPGSCLVGGGEVNLLLRRRRRGGRRRQSRRRGRARRRRGLRGRLAACSVHRRADRAR